ncbi:MAG: hypothetical protein HGA76_10510, partial [Candidatus Firestonebacteria bacterium]|nr:hypothetical protein [Candidatus Firestonebacteria bacterium]
LSFTTALQNIVFPEAWGELAGFVAMMYALLGFSNIMKDQTKFEKASVPSQKRLTLIQEMVWERLAQAAPQLQEVLTPAEIAELKHPLKIRLFSENGQPDWLKEFFRSGLHVFKENVYWRRRLFNLLNDRTAADLIFQKILKRKLPLETAETIARNLTGRDPQQDEMLLAKILKGKPSQEMTLVITLMNRQNAVPTTAERGALQRSALEKRYQVKFLNADNTYARELAGSWSLLNEKMRIIVHYEIPVHPYFLRLSTASLRKLGKYLEWAHPRTSPDYTACRKIIETGDLDARAGFWPLLGMRLTLALPVLARERPETHWLKTRPNPYLRLLLSSDRSLLAQRLCDRRTPEAKAFIAWAKAPGEVTLRTWVRLMLETLNRPNLPEAEIIASLKTFSRLSRSLAALRGRASGTWRNPPPNDPGLWTPNLLWEPGAGGLRGTLVELVKTLPLNFMMPEPQWPKHPRWELLDLGA